MKSIPKSNLHRYCPKTTAMAFGTVWGILILLTGWISMTGWGYQFVSILSSIYTGYNSSFVGGVIGGIWGFFYGAAIGFAFGLLYNRLLMRQK